MRSNRQLALNCLLSACVLTVIAIDVSANWLTYRLLVIGWYVDATN